MDDRKTPAEPDSTPHAPTESASASHPPQNQRAHEQRTLFFAIATAIGFHIAMLLVVNGMTLLSHHGSGNDTRNDPFHASEYDASRDVNREKYLKAALTNFVAEEMVTQKRPSPTNESDHKPQIEDTSAIPLPNTDSNVTARSAEQLPTPDKFVMDVTDTMTPSDAPSSPTAGESSMAIDFGDDDALTRDLIQATDVIAGVLPQAYSETSSPTTASDSVGQRKDATLDNIGTERRSGALDAGTRAGATSGRPAAVGGDAGQTATASTPQVATIAGNDVTADAAASLGSIASSNDFYVQLKYTPAPDGGYLFQVKLVPKEGVQFLRIKQNVFFLIDRSHSIDKRQYATSKKAVIDCLEMLQADDTFNIFVFDKGVVKMSETPIAWSSDAIQQARQFLANQPYGGMFASTDLYSSLDKIVPKAVADTEVNTAILMSDGDTFLPREKQRSTISQWSLRNRGKVSLFCVAAGSGNNLSLLDLLAANNKGTLAYCRQQEDLPATLKDLAQKIQNPIGKDIVVTVIPPDDGTEITIFPRPRRLADLYEHTPYVLCGHVNQMSDFYIFLQGRYYDRWFDIKQLVSFEKGKPGNAATMEKTWAIHQAYECYDHFLAEGDASHLYQAKRLLDPYKIPVAFP